MTWMYPIALFILAALIPVGIIMWATLMARHIDGVHRTVVKSRIVLEHSLAARAQYARDLAHAQILDIASSLLLEEAAEKCLSAAMLPVVNDGLETLPHEEQVRLDIMREDMPDEVRSLDRRTLESDLSRTLRLTLDAVDAADLNDLDPQQREILERLQRSRMNVRLARRFHNSHVAVAHRLRNGFWVRNLRLYGKAAQPIAVDIDDE